jgi:hypothetical protein
MSNVKKNELMPRKVVINRAISAIFINAILGK